MIFPQTSHNFDHYAHTIFHELWPLKYDAYYAMQASVNHYRVQYLSCVKIRSIKYDANGSRHQILFTMYSASHAEYVILGPELFSTIPGLGVGWPLKLEFTPEFPIRVLNDVRNSWEKAGIRSGILHLKFRGCP
jgi:hypothetical protein